jgi:hypothetical protein
MHGEAEAHYQYPDDAGFWDDFRKWSFRQQLVGIFVAIVLAYLALCAVCGAVYGMWWGIGYATMSIFGLTVFETAGEFLLVAVIAGFVGLVIYGFMSLIGFMGHEPEPPSNYAFIVPFTWVIVFHLIMTISLAPLKREVDRIYEANPNPPGVVHLAEDSAYNVEYDYGGRVTAITVQRDERLKRYGYVGVFSGWNVSWFRGGNTGVYVFLPGYALLSDMRQGQNGVVNQTTPK